MQHAVLLGEESLAAEEGLSRTVESGGICGALSTLDYLGSLANHNFKTFFNSAQVGYFTNNIFKIIEVCSRRLFWPASQAYENLEDS